MRIKELPNGDLSLLLEKMEKPSFGLLKRNKRENLHAEEEGGDASSLPNDEKAVFCGCTKGEINELLSKNKEADATIDFVTMMNERHKNSLVHMILKTEEGEEKDYYTIYDVETDKITYCIFGYSYDPGPRIFKRVTPLEIKKEETASLPEVDFSLPGFPFEESDNLLSKLENFLKQKDTPLLGKEKLSTYETISQSQLKKLLKNPLTPKKAFSPSSFIPISVYQDGDDKKALLFQGEEGFCLVARLELDEERLIKGIIPEGFIPKFYEFISFEEENKRLVFKKTEEKKEGEKKEEAAESIEETVSIEEAKGDSPKGGGASPESDDYVRIRFSEELPKLSKECQAAERYLEKGKAPLEKPRQILKGKEGLRARLEFNEALKVKDYRLSSFDLVTCYRSKAGLLCAVTKHKRIGFYLILSLLLKQEKGRVASHDEVMLIPSSYEYGGEANGELVFVLKKEKETEEKAKETKPLGETTPQKETPKKEELPNEEAVAEENISEALNVPKEKRIPVRKVFDWGRNFEDCYKNDKELERRIKEIIDTYLYEEREETRGKWDDTKHDFAIPVRNGAKKIWIHRARIAGNYANRRLFYCFGDQMGDDRFNDKDIILLYISDSDEHDDYEKIAEKLADSIDRKVDFAYLHENKKEEKESKVFLYNRYLGEKEDGSYSKVPLLTNEQQNLLSDSFGAPPSLVYGAAGTGKTLMSEQLCKKIKEAASKGTRILYLTFMPMLANHVKQELENYGVGKKEVDCWTYREFVRQSLEGASEMGAGSEYAYEIEIDGKKVSREKGFAYFYRWISGAKDVKHSMVKGVSEVEKLRRERVNLSLIDPNLYDAASTIYLFFRSFNQERDYAYFLNGSLERFKKDLSDEKDLDGSRIEVIYKYCWAYASHLKEFNYLDDNMASFLVKELFKNGSLKEDKFDAVIVDELQDLTLPEIDSIAAATKGRSFYAYGDDNQSINPSLLRMREAKKRIYQDFGIDKKEMKESFYLTEVMRSSPEVVEYINLLNDIRKKTVGTDKLYSENPLVSLTSAKQNEEAAKPAYLLDASAFKALVSDESLSLQNEIAIITPSDAKKQDFLKLYPSFPQDEVFTIEEIKGREREIVILYDFFSASPNVWQRIAEKYKEDKGQEKFYSTLYRRYFNRYYVGLTRARKKVILFETSKVSEEVKICFLCNKDFPLEEISSSSHLSSYFSNDFTYDRWLSNAKQYFALKEYKDAYAYIKNARACLEKEKGNPSFNELAYEECLKLEQEYAFLDAYSSLSEDSPNLEGDIEKAQRCVDFLLGKKDIEKARELYKKFFPEKDNLAHIYKYRERKGLDSYLKKYEELKPSLTETEKEYFSLNALNCYQEIIRKKLGGLTYGRKKHR